MRAIASATSRGALLPERALGLEHERAHDDDALRPRLGPLEQFFVVAGEAHQPLRPAPAAAGVGRVPGADDGVVGADPDEGDVDRLEPLVAHAVQKVGDGVAGAAAVQQPVLCHAPVEQGEVRGAGPPLSEAVSQEGDEHGSSLRLPLRGDRLYAAVAGGSRQLPSHGVRRVDLRTFELR